MKKTNFLFAAVLFAALSLGFAACDSKEYSELLEKVESSTSVVGVRADTDGVYYWTLNGEWLLDDDGNKLQVTGKDGADGEKGDTGQSGVTPRFKIENGDWYISYDNGATWDLVGQATGDKGETGSQGEKGDIGDSMFQSVTQDADSVYFILADGSSFSVAKGDYTPDSSTQGIGVFSVSDDTQVSFSPGNLQYHPANDAWRFAENQTDYIGDANSNISGTYNGWLDLFDWGTGSLFSSDGSSSYSTFVDWGTNQIGADAPNTWRTLTVYEWVYVVFDRPNASSLMGVAQVNGVNGLVFLPDNWTCPEGVTFKSGFSNYGVEYYAAYQTFTADQWSKMESAGAVFLPAAGYRIGSALNYVQYYGNYWSATEYDGGDAYYLDFHTIGAYMSYYFRSYGRSVRLVKDL